VIVAKFTKSQKIEKFENLNIQIDCEI
jgi:hypothetical protein